MSGVLDGDESAETSCQKCPCHVWESEKQQGATTECVNGPESWEGKEEVDETKSEGGPESLVVCEARVLEDGRRVERDDVDTAHLLSNHDCERSQGGPTDSWDSEELDEAGEDVVIADNLVLNLNLGVNVVQITSSLDRILAKNLQRLESLLVSILLCMGLELMLR